MPSINEINLLNSNILSVEEIINRTTEGHTNSSSSNNQTYQTLPAEGWEEEINHPINQEFEVNNNENEGEGLVDPLSDQVQEQSRVAIEYFQFLISQRDVTPPFHILTIHQWVLHILLRYIHRDNPLNLVDLTPLYGEPGLIHILELFYRDGPLISSSSVETTSAVNGLPIPPPSTPTPYINYEDEFIKSIPADDNIFGYYKMGTINIFSNINNFVEKTINYLYENEEELVNELTFYFIIGTVAYLRGPDSEIIIPAVCVPDFFFKTPYLVKKGFAFYSSIFYPNEDKNTQESQIILEPQE